MNLPLRVGYEGAALLARALAAVAPASGGKLLRSFAARRGVRDRFAAFVRRPGRPLLWMHAPSVGEGLQARPVLELCTRTAARGAARVHLLLPERRAIRAVRWTSISATCCHSTRRRMRARHSRRSLPPRSCSASSMCGRRSRARRPGAECDWASISATLARGSSRRRGLAAALLRDAYARLDRVGAISDDDAERLVATRRAGGAHQRHGRHALRSGVGPRGGSADSLRPLLAPLRGATADARRRLDLAVGRAACCSARGAASASGIPRRD